MVKECAVDPEAMGDSYDRFTNLLDRFGLHQGRVISEFPETWCARVQAACSKLRPVEKLRVTERLVQARGTRVLKFRRPYSDRIGDWLSNAVHQHKNGKSFHAIVGSRSDAGIQEIVLPQDVNDEHPLFAPNSGGMCPRSPIDLADLLGPYLSYSREILFVDPFFNPTVERWRGPLKRILAAAASGNQIARVEYHFVEHRDTLPLADIERHAKTLFPQVLPRNVSIKLYQWRERQGSEEFHARYVLTEKVGISIDAGLSAGEHGEKTDWALLVPAVRKQRWAALQPGSTVYDLVDKPLTIDAQGRCTRS